MGLPFILLENHWILDIAFERNEIFSAKGDKKVCGVFIVFEPGRQFLCCVLYEGIFLM